MPFAGGQERANRSHAQLYRLFQSYIRDKVKQFREELGDAMVVGFDHLLCYRSDLISVERGRIMETPN